MTKKEIKAGDREDAAMSKVPLPSDDLRDYRPRTRLGRRLLEIRAQLLASGEKLLTWEEIEREVAERRGGEEEHTK